MEVITSRCELSVSTLQLTKYKYIHLLFSVTRFFFADMVKPKQQLFYQSMCPADPPDGHISCSRTTDKGRYRVDCLRRERKQGHCRSSPLVREI